MGLFDYLSRFDAMKRNVTGLFAHPMLEAQRLMGNDAEFGAAPSLPVQAREAMGYTGSVFPEVRDYGHGLFGSMRREQINPMAMQIALNAITAYHGSPYQFDEFDASKIGTGEGAQAYGHGLYFAENPKVAKTYAQTGAPFTVDGMTWTEIQNRWNKDLPWDRGMKRAINALADEQGDIAAALSKLRTGGPMSVDAADALQSMVAAGRIKPVTNANLYKVDIPDEAVAKMLDWDKPLSEQPQGVVDLVRQRLKDQKYLGPNDNGPRQLNAAIRSWRMEHGGMADSPMEALVAGRGGLLGTSPEEVSANLHSSGVPGIKYLDQGSRVAGEGTHNFVLFDPKLAKILGRE
jgi:hypothetical protein